MKHLRPLRLLVLSLLSTATPALAAEPVLTQQPGQSNAAALSAFEAQLPEKEREDLNKALRWLVRHHDYHFNQLVGMTAEQIIERAGRERAHLAAQLNTANATPKRITFAKGAVEAEVKGELGSHGGITYLVNAMAGQEMHVKVQPTTNVKGPDENPPLILIIYGKDGTVLMSDHATSSTFGGPLPISEDYNIDVRNLTKQDVPYTLTVKIITPEEKTAFSSPPASSSVVEAGSKPAQLSAQSWQTKPLKPGQYEWHPDASTEGDMNVVVSLSQQEAFVYRGGVMIGRSTVSTGKKGHRTPTGVFHIMTKEKMHHSNKYNNAPMPFSERLTWGGIFLHAGEVPGYESSHGCIHLPYDFSKDLFSVTRKGVPVVITQDHVHVGVDEQRKFMVLSTEPPKQ